MSSIGGSGGTKPPGKVVKRIINKIFLNREFIMLVPFIMLGVTAVTTLIKNMGVYGTIYEYLSQIIGYSIITNLWFLKYAKAHKFCAYSFVSIYSLLGLNVLSVLSMAFGISDNGYYKGFDLIVVIALFMLAVKYLINKK